MGGIERGLLEYAANAAWQFPLLAAGGWLLVRAVRPGVAAQCRIWTAVLLLAALLPLRGALVNNAGTEAEQGGAAATVISSGVTVSSAGNLDRASAPGATAAQPGWWERGASGMAGAGAVVLGFAGWVQPVRLSAAAAGWLAFAFALALLAGLERIWRAWLAVRRLVSRSPEMTLTDAERRLVEECARRMGVGVPEMRVSREIAGPVTAGFFHPVLLWPEGKGWLNDAQDEAQAALCHEMAHLHRRDYAMNLLCGAAAAGLRWHPATYAVERRIRNAREMACDEQAAAALGSETAYARSLVRLAASMAVGGNAEFAGALGLFNGNVLEERVMQLTETKTVMSARTRWVRGVAGAAGMLAALGLAGAFYVAPALAQTIPTQPQAPLVEQAAPAQPQTPVPPQVPVVTREAAQQTAPAIAVPGAIPATPAIPLPPEAQSMPKAPPIPMLPAAAPPDVTRPTVPPAPAVPTIPSNLAAPPAPPAPVVPRARAKQIQIEAQLAAATARLSSPEFRAKLEKAQRKAMKAERKIESKKFQKQMAKVQKQIAAATAKLNSPEFREQLQREVQAELNSQKVQMQMAAAQRQIAATEARLNSPAFRKQMQQAVQVAAKVDSAKIQKQMDQARKQLSNELQQMQTGQQR